MNPIPQWQRELDNFVGIKSVFIIEGNVSDLHPFSQQAHETGSQLDSVDDLLFLRLEELLPRLFAGTSQAPRAYKFLFCDPLRGITNPLADPDLPQLVRAATAEAERMQQDAQVLNFSPKQQPFNDNLLVHNSQLMRAALTRRLDLGATASAAQGFSLCCVYNLASRLTSRPTDLSAEENAVFMNLILGSKDAIRGNGADVNTLVLVVNKLTDVPSWFFMDNADVRTLAIPNPDRDRRAIYVQAAFPDLAGLPKVRDKFVDVTDGMKILELDELRRLHVRGATDPARVCELVDLYKYGLKEDEWASIVDKLRDAPEEALRRRVKGQDRAIERIVTVLKRSVMGMSGMQHSSGTKPKGVLFLAGPTGTGKTEVVKAVTELLFGDERSYLRFDMSEYASENSDQKLFGAPPGYVGYEEGGQLTNAVKANPFSVLLFDEVEKAHPSIMDKFLQILEDGRMTDGQGNTVHFSETLIFFTSNVGISEEVYDEFGHVVGRRNVVEPGEPYDQIEAKVAAAMAKHFKPEVLNRIGDNIVVFDYIGEEASRLIVEAQVRKIEANLAERRGITLSTTPAALDLLVRESLASAVREKGGRGIGNLIEARYLNPLSNHIFDQAITAGSTVCADADTDGVTFR